ncbi:MAG: glucose-6-phosphate isomerase [Planctomycetota bacterium]
MFQLALTSVASQRSPEAFARYRETALEALSTIDGNRPGYLTTLDKGLWDLTVDTAARVAPPSKIVILGIGGSALGARTLADALTPELRDKLVVLDNVDPHTITSAISDDELGNTLFIAISKSGSTAETTAQLLYFRQRLLAAGHEDWASRFIAITDPEKGALRELVEREGLLSLPVPSDVGGRFSVLTPVGLLPAQLLGIDGGELVEGARRVRDSIFDNLEGDAAGALADLVATHATLSLDHGQPIQVMLSYCDRLGTFGDWYCQLWAESLGKKHDLTGKVVHRGSTPIGAVGATDQHSLVQLFRDGPDDKQYWILSVDETGDPAAIENSAAEVHSDFDYLGGTSIDDLFRAERHGTAAALRAAGRPVTELTLDRLDAASLGGLFLWFELATSVAGALYDVDPYDQPGVEAGKIAAFALMKRAGYEEKAREILEAAKSDQPRNVTIN